MRRRVHLLGPFAAFHDGPIEIVADTVWDAIEAVVMQVKGFQPDPVAGRKVIQAIGFDTMEKLKARDTETTDVYLHPALLFGKEGGLVQTVIGITLIVVSVALGGPGTGWFAAMLLNVGVAMIIGGVIQMLTPQPQINSNNEDVRSKYLAAVQNTVRIGTTIPLLYGRRRCGGHIMSINIDAKDTGL